MDISGDSVREQTVFPTAETTEEFKLFSHNRGNISISLDRERVLVASSNQGIALEVRLSDGVILNVFRNVHDLTGLNHNLGEAGDRAIYLVFKDLQFVE